MKTYNNFNEVFNANSNTNKSLSVFNEYLDVNDWVDVLASDYYDTDDTRQSIEDTLNDSIWEHCDGQCIYASDCLDIIKDYQAFTWDDQISEFGKVTNIQQVAFGAMYLDACEHYNEILDGICERLGIE